MAFLLFTTVYMGCNTNSGCMLGGGRWAVGSGQWAVDSFGWWVVDSLAVGGGQFSSEWWMVSGGGGGG